MLKMTTTRHDSLQGRQHKMVANVLNDTEQPFDTVIDLSICGGRQYPMQDIETHDEQIPLAEHPHGTKRSRQAADSATRLSMERHGWKQTGKTSSLWMFEHRWPHLRDRAEGRNHSLPSK